MTVTEGIILGLVQGITEFLPISSTGHLILVREFFSISHNYGLAIDAVLQLATALAVLVYFRAEFFHLLKQAIWMVKGLFVAQPPVAFGDRALVLALVGGTVPAVILGLLLEERMETIFRSAELVASMLIVGSLLNIHSNAGLLAHL
jgi:undecaprenyl-diphosphatase